MSEKRTKNEKFAIEKLGSHLRLYEGCGNMLGIVPLSLAGYPPDMDWTQDGSLRRFLSGWGKQIRSDSVMVLTGSPSNPEQPYDFFMDVFEPNGTDDTGNGLLGGISTMCGNGVRAVAAYTRTFKPETTKARIMTRSGLRIIEIDPERNLYAVNMGQFNANPPDLFQYVHQNLVRPNNNGDYIDSPIPAEILQQLKKYVSATTWSIGLNGDRNDHNGIDGEPHVVIEIPQEEITTIEKLREIAVAAGPVVTKALSYFPHEICVNFISIRTTDDKRMTVWNCTHERNLGDDPDHSVTAACGTGSTVVGAVMFRKGLVKPQQVVEVINTGGTLEISMNHETGNLIMKGPANPCSLD